ncbi:UNVERIFIED_CONTAM: hypothetical protein Slati_1678900 [Sesamum latifolium]|uniref:Uncharacterized protein n=1 Tax=Sesamum latifolium TaxID=2727402 RepID=A0AAW2WV44_9LAMI
MHTRSRTRNGNGGVGELEGISEHASKRKSNNRSAPGGRKATEDLKSRKSSSELQAT